jgi:hypothetical protein
LLKSYEPNPLKTSHGTNSKGSCFRNKAKNMVTVSQNLHRQEQLNWESSHICALTNAQPARRYHYMQQCIHQGVNLGYIVRNHYFRPFNSIRRDPLHTTRVAADELDTTDPKEESGSLNITFFYHIFTFTISCASLSRMLLFQLMSRALS